MCMSISTIIFPAAFASQLVTKCWMNVSHHIVFCETSRVFRLMTSLDSLLVFSAFHASMDSPLDSVHVPSIAGLAGLAERQAYIGPVPHCS